MADQLHPKAQSGRWRRVSIRRRVISLILLLALPIALERGVALLNARNQQIADTIDRLRQTVQIVALAQSENISAATAVVQTLGPQATSLMADPAACEALLRQISGEVLGVQGAWIGTIEGRVRCTNARALLNVDLSDRDYVQKALKSPQPAVSDFFVTRNTARSGIAIASAERDAKGDPVALAAVGLDLQWMSRSSVHAGLSGVHIWVVDGAGAVLARHPVPTTIPETMPSAAPLLQAMMAHDDGTLQAPGPDGVTRYFAYVRLPGTAIRVLAGIDPADATRAIDQRILATLGLLFSALTALTLIAIYAADRLIVAPIDQMARDILAAGRDETRGLGEAEVREFEPVMRAFEAMNRRLDERTAGLRNINRRLTALASTDGLTGLANRRTFDVQFSDEWVHGADAGRPLALVMADVDNFKLYNDTMGHLQGDEALRSVARMLAAAVAGTPNLAARYGGEEFIVLLPGCDVAAAVEFAEDVRRLVAALGIDHPKTAMRRLTASFGVAAAVPSLHGSPDALLASADGALYEAKRLGRNRVVAARGPAEAVRV
ncbi:sensor domain-containing diguanylate cyclase [Aquabacter spiritensis]|uniref:diguanylate cyclase n=1 Tax=Aquabacter spiritensis TaxID=933073 RepID=A0A4R3M0Z3_9HYPH|nr:GGDEF domain-containing protein [Aquabacter spiritensis]TCT06754.1 diguanylate cyclase (GGDEF)-like protein [Aquabacter spiritensis]